MKGHGSEHASLLSVNQGQQDNVLPFLRAMDVFLLPSLREQMP